MTQAERLARAAALYARRTAEQQELADLRTQLSSATDNMRVVANLFSASVWKILPAKIKAYFEAYREA